METCIYKVILFWGAIFLFVAGSSGIRFCLAQLDPLGNGTSGITRTYTDLESFSMSEDKMKITSVATAYTVQRDYDYLPSMQLAKRSDSISTFDTDNSQLNSMYSFFA